MSEGKLTRMSTKYVMNGASGGAPEYTGSAAAPTAASMRAKSFSSVISLSSLADACQVCR